MGDEGLILDIYSSVLALFDFEPQPPKFLGTAFVIDGYGTFLTARHVLKDQNGMIKAVSIEHPSVRGAHPRVDDVEDIVLARDVDLARGRLVDRPGVRPIRPSSKHPRLGGDVLCAEFSLSTQVDPETNRMGIGNPRIQKGHIVSSFSSDQPPHQRPTQCYELSFPALLGASGAPVIDLDDFTAIGVVVANVATHLLPAQIERVQGEMGSVEEIRYYLPHANAIAYTEFGAVIRPPN